MILAIWSALIGAIYSQTAQFWALDRNFFPVKETAFTKPQQQSDFKAYLKIT